MPEERMEKTKVIDLRLMGGLWMPYIWQYSY
jgi:hypothetical protein